MSIDILVIDDEEDIRHLIQGILEDEGYKTRSARGSATAFEQIAKKTPDLIILDVWLQGSEKDGLQILSAVKVDHPHLPVIMISGHGTIETAVSAIKQGAYDFIEKPFKTDRLLTMMVRALESASLKKENISLKLKADIVSDIRYTSHSATELKTTIDKIAPAGSRVMIMGEAGCGKETIARLIHAKSPRAQRPFSVVNCASLNLDNFETMLFTGGNGHARGIFDETSGGSVLLYEVSDIPMDIQGRLVKILQDQSFSPAGSKEPIRFDVRVLSCTRKNMSDEIKAGRFREDLFYRLNVASIHAPSLRERVQDIPDMAREFIEKFSREAGFIVPTLSDPAITALQSYVWPGNIRELKNEMERAVMMCGGQEIIDRVHLSPAIIGENALKFNEGQGGDDYLSMPLREARELFEKKYLQAQMIRFEGSVSETSRFIGMERSALHRKLKTLGITGGDKSDEEGSSDQDISDGEMITTSEKRKSA